MIRIKMRLSRRLEAIYQRLQPNGVLADIGTDHGLLPIKYVCSGLGKVAYAGDIAPEPLERARSNIDRYQLSSQVFPVLSNGLQEIPKDADSIVIAGMGVDNVIAILSAVESRWSSWKQLIIQVNSKEYDLRIFLNQSGFRIIHEVCVYDRGKYYVIIDALFTGAANGYEKLHCLLGPYLMSHPSSTYLAYLKTHLERYRSILAATTNDDVEERVQMIAAYLERSENDEKFKQYRPEIL